MVIVTDGYEDASRESSGKMLSELKKAPELFMFDVPGKLINGYPYVERFSEGGGRQVVALVRQYGAAPKAAKQLRLGMDVPEQLELGVED